MARGPPDGHPGLRELGREGIFEEKRVDLSGYLGKLDGAGDIQLVVA